MTVIPASLTRLMIVRGYAKPLSNRTADARTRAMPHPDACDASPGRVKRLTRTRGTGGRSGGICLLVPQEVLHLREVGKGGYGPPLHDAEGCDRIGKADILLQLLLREC